MKIRLSAALQDTLFRQPVAFHVRIPLPDAAIKAVVPAAIADFDEASDENPVAEMKLAHFTRLLVDVTQGLCVTSCQQLPEHFLIKRFIFSQPVNPLFHAEMKLAHFTRLLVDVTQGLCVTSCQQLPEHFLIKRFIFSQPVNPLFHSSLFV